MAAADFLSSPQSFREAVRSAPPGWAQKNMQVVLQTKVAGDMPGPPQVLSVHVW